MSKDFTKRKIIIPSYKSFQRVISDSEFYNNKYYDMFCMGYEHRFVYYPKFYIDWCTKENSSLSKTLLRKLEGLGFKDTDVIVNSIPCNKDNMESYMLILLHRVQDKYKNQKKCYSYVITATQEEKLTCIFEKEKSDNFKFYYAF